MNYDDLLLRLNPLIESQAKYIAWMCEHFYGSVIDWQDLAQAARMYLWQYLERQVDAPGPQMLIILGRLRMYAERSRGKSVLRAHPGKRKQHYERASLEQANAFISRDLDPVTGLTDEQERDFLLAHLALAQQCEDDQAEHMALLALRRLARDLEDDQLRARCNEHLRIWWKRSRLQAEEVRP